MDVKESGLGCFGMSRGGDVASGAGVGAGAGDTLADDGVGKGTGWADVPVMVEASASSEAAGTAAGPGGGEEMTLSGREREKPNQEDREGVDLVARSVFCGSAEGNGTGASGSGPVEATSDPPVDSSAGAAGSRQISIGFGDSVRSTGFVIVPEFRSAFAAHNWKVEAGVETCVREC